MTNQYYNLFGLVVDLEKFKSAKVAHSCLKGWYVKVSYGLFKSVNSQPCSEGRAHEELRQLVHAVNQYHNAE